LINETVISSPAAAGFSWPGDIGDIIFRNQQEFRQNTQSMEQGLYLRSGMFTLNLIPHLKKLGLQWTNIEDSSGTLKGAYIYRNFLLLFPQKKTVGSVQECVDSIDVAQNKMIILSYDAAHPLTAEIIAGIALGIGNNPLIKSVTPGQLLQDAKYAIPYSTSISIAPDLQFWMQSPVVWQKLDTVRRAIEEYKNSGQAQLKTLGKLRDALYRLYDYELLTRLQSIPVKEEDEKQFQTGVSTIYHLLNYPQGEEPDYAQTASSAAAVSVFEVASTTSSLTITNTPSSRPAFVEQFSMTLDQYKVYYAVRVSTPAVSGSIDIYMDMNNQEGAGLMRLLPGLEAFMNTANAWEFALRIEKDRASLYRSGRFEPTLVATYTLRKPFEVEIPRTVLRGNPLFWGYQVVLSEKKGNARLAINDFLSQEDKSRQKMLANFPVQLNAIRAAR
jgi:hypothetical protein